MISVILLCSSTECVQANTWKETAVMIYLLRGIVCSHTEYCADLYYKL